MPADGRINATGDVHAAIADNLVVEFLAHAVEALEFEIAATAGKLDHRGQRVGVVGGELRVEGVGVGEQALGTGDVGDIGGGLAGKHRVVRQAQFLAPLDLAVPVGALDQTHHQTAIMPARHVGQPVDLRQAALLVGLDGEAETVPAL